MKKVVALFTGLMFALVLLSALPVSAGIQYCWFNKWIKVDDSWISAPTQVTAPLGTDVEWSMGITVELPDDWGGDVENVVVYDRFGAEIEIEEPFPVCISQGTVSYTTKGKSEKAFLKWEIGTLSPGDTACLEILISTDLNPAGKQEYTSPGCYELNSGAVLKFTFEGKKYSAHTHPIIVQVEER